MWYSIPMIEKQESRMKLAQALKKKNRLVGEINRTKALIIGAQMERICVSSSQKDALLNEKTCDPKNTKISDETKGKFNVELTKFVTLTDELIQLKTAISTANVKIYSKIVLLEELKNRLATFEMLNSGKPNVAFYDSHVDIVAYSFTDAEKDELVERTRKQIEETQDAIDYFNATTDII